MSNIYQFSRDGTSRTGRSGSLPDKLAAAATFDDVGRFYQVKSIYRDILSKDPACEPARHRPGVLDFQAGQVVAALKLIGSAAVLGSNNGVFSMSLASTLRCTGREEEFTAACHECVTFDTENPATRNAGNLAEDVCEICTGNLDRSTFQ